MKYDAKLRSDESALVFDENDPLSRSLTQQHFAEECDIGNIVDRINKSGVMPPDMGSPRYGDFSNIPDYQSSLNAVNAANAAFAALPAEIRDRFKNDPTLLLEFIHDDKNYDEAVKLGLIDKKPLEPSPEPIDSVGEGSNPPPAPASKKGNKAQLSSMDNPLET